MFSLHQFSCLRCAQATFLSRCSVVSYVVAIVSTVVFTIYFGNKSIREVSVMELIKAKSESNKTSNLPNGATKKESKE